MGGQGMAGHMIAGYFHRMTRCELAITIRPQGGCARSGAGPASANPLPAGPNVQIRELDVLQFSEVDRTVREVKPDLIINAVGLLNQEAENRPEEAWHINGLLPHGLARLADGLGARLIHISTDCVFSGLRGMYKEEDLPDGTSIYARTKAFGEVTRPPHVTVRTSIIGPDRKADGIGLMQWFLSQKGKVYGYRNVIWNGVTTLELAKACLHLAGRPEIAGLVHLAAPQPVSKHDLLGLMQQIFEKRDAEVIPKEEPRIDRTLAATRRDVQFDVPDYRVMLRQLRDWMCAN
jgi:dTDP-4-dehydrorhamnose reductase